MPMPHARADGTARDVAHLSRPEVTATQPAWIQHLLITDSHERKNFGWSVWGACVFFFPEVKHEQRVVMGKCPPAVLVLPHPRTPALSYCLASPSRPQSGQPGGAQRAERRDAHPTSVQEALAAQTCHQSPVTACSSAWEGTWSLQFNSRSRCSTGRRSVSSITSN